MRTLAIGDIHGCLEALQHLATLVEITPEDTVITLGDYVDRGPDSKGVLDFLIEFSQTGQLIPIRGNHDIMMMEARESRSALLEWQMSGGIAALESYTAASMDDIPAAHWEFLEATLPYHETETHFFVHANAHFDLPLEDQPEEALYWEKFGTQPPHQSGKIMVCGHTAQKSGKPKKGKQAICIDTRVYDTGWLTCLDTGNNIIWQAHESGATRQFMM